MSKSALVVGLASALALAGCGSAGGHGIADKSPEEIAQRIAYSVQSLGSAHLSGYVRQAQGQLSFDLSADRHGTCSGTVGFYSRIGDIRSAEGASYLRGDYLFWERSLAESDGDLARAFDGHWVKTRASTGAEGLESMCDLGNVLDEFDDEFDGDLTRGEITTVRGIEAVELTVETATATSHYWIGLEDERLLRAVQNGREGDAAISFSAFDEPVKVVLPAPGDFIDLSGFRR